MDVKETLERMRDLSDEEVKNGTVNCVRRKKVKVTQGRHVSADGKNVISVQEPFGDEFEVPYVPALMYVSAGDTVWIEWVYGFGNACAVNSGAWQKSDLPTCVVPTEDGLVIQVNYESVMVVSPDGVTLNTDSLTVSGKIQGNVVNTQGAETVTVSGKIQDAIDNLGKYLEGDVTVQVPAGTYVEFVDVNGFVGNGCLTISFADGAVLNGNMRISGCRKVRVVGDNDTTGSVILGVDGDDPLVIDATGFCEIDGMTIHGCERTATVSQDHAIAVMNGTYARIVDTQTDRADVGIYVRHAHADIINCKGGAVGDYQTVANLVDGILIDADGGSVNARGTIPMGPSASGTGYTDNGYTFCKGGGVDPVPTASDGSTPPPEVTDVTVTWTALQGYYTYGTYPNSTATLCEGWKTGAPRTGTITDQNYGVHKTAGMWILDGAATIATTLQNATIKKAVVTLHRTGGTAAGTSVILCGHNLSSVQGFTYECDPFKTDQENRDDKYTDGLCFQTMAAGDTASFELPASAFASLQDGTIKGFMVSSALNAQSMTFNAAKCDLAVTYTPGS